LQKQRDKLESKLRKEVNFNLIENDLIKLKDEKMDFQRQIEELNLKNSVLEKENSNLLEGLKQAETEWKEQTKLLNEFDKNLKKQI